MYHLYIASSGRSIPSVRSADCSAGRSPGGNIGKRGNRSAEVVA